MIDAIRTYVRYETPADRGHPDKIDETRREFNTRFGQPSPEIDVPDAGRYIWNWYFDLSSCIRRARDGGAEPIPPSEFLAWRAATGEIVYPHEYAILRVMDVAYRDELNKEIADSLDRATEGI